MHLQLRMLREVRRQAAPVLECAPERWPDELADLVEPALFAISVPEHHVAALANPTAPHETPQDERDGQIEPSNRLCALEDEVADDRVVRPVADPVIPLRRGRDAAAQLLRSTALPVRAMPQRVDLDVTRVQQLGEPRAETTLAAATRADHDETGHSRNSPRATMTAEPPASTSSGERATANSVDGRPLSAPWWISISSPKPIRPCRARWSARGPAAEPVAGSSPTPCAGTKTRAFQPSPSRAKHTVPYRLSSSTASLVGLRAAPASGESSSM